MKHDSKRNCSYLGGSNRINYHETRRYFSANKRNIIPKAALAHSQGKRAETLITWHPLWRGCPVYRPLWCGGGQKLTNTRYGLVFFSALNNFDNCQCGFCKSWIDAKRSSHFLKWFPLNIMLLISMINSYQVALLLAFVAAPISIIFQYYSCHLQSTCILYPNISQEKVIIRKDVWKVSITDTPHDTQYTLHLTWKFCDTYLKSFLECLRYSPQLFNWGLAKFKA